MPKYISSRKNPTVVLAASLSEKKERERQGLFRFDGKKLFCEACACGVEIWGVFIREGDDGSLCDFVNKCALDNNIEIEDRLFILSEPAFDRISEEKSPEGIITVAKYIDKLRKIATIDNIKTNGIGEYVPHESRVMALESVRDPGNLGTVIRTAAALGVDTLILSSDCADIYNPRTLRAAMGAVFTRRIVITDDLPAVLVALEKSGRRTVAAALTDSACDAESLALSSRDCVVVGNEGHGLSADVISACSVAAILPMERGPGIESLNASVAAAIFIWLCRREPKDPD